MELLYIEGREQIIGYAETVLEMCDRAYQPIGGFLSLSSKDDFKRRVSQLKLVWTRLADGTPKLGACAIYRNVRDGIKAIGYAGNKGIVPEYRECTQMIIRDDVSAFNGWYWAEASDAIAHYFEKNGGIMMPNVYVPTILDRRIPDEDLLEDGFSYVTTVGGFRQPTRVQKRLYGFPNKDFYDKIMEVYGTFDNFSDYVNKLRDGIIKMSDISRLEALGMPSDKQIDKMLPEDIKKIMSFIYNMDETCMENRLVDVPSKWITLLDFAIKTLTAVYKRLNNKTIEEAICLGIELKNKLIPLVIGQIKVTAPPHKTVK